MSPADRWPTCSRAQGRLPERVVDIGLDLADALTRAHCLGILHRDLKPANVLLAGDGTPRRADFGIARLGGGAPLTQTGVLMGTVDYLSPRRAGFDLSRAGTPGAEPARLNQALVPDQAPGPPGGAVYAWEPDSPHQGSRTRKLRSSLS